MDSAARFYYDIGTLIVTDSSQLGAILGTGIPSTNGGGAGVALSGAAAASVPVQRMAAGSIRVSAPPPPSKMVDIKVEETPEEYPEYLASGNPCIPGAFFCGECGMRMTKHTSKVRKTTEGERVRVFTCPNLV